MSLTKVIYSMIDGAPVNILDFGADPTGTDDSTAAIQNAINATSTPLAVYFPAGVYKVTSTITVDRDRIMLYGDGVASRINFVPTADDICFLFDKGAGATSSMVQCTVQNLAFYSSDTTYKKTIFKLIDISQCIFDNVQTLSPHVHGNGSIFLHINGRDSSAFRNLFIRADINILISPDPDSSIIGIDHFNFHNLYLGNATGSPYPLIEIEDGVALTQVSFTGLQAWTRGNGGLKWTDTTSAGISNGLYLNNIRYENNQDPDNTYFVEINRSSTDLQNLVLSNCFSNNSKGLYLRKVRGVYLDGFYFADNAREAINADATVYPIETNNSFFQSGSTSSLTGIELYESQANVTSGGVRENAYYGLTLANNLKPSIVNNQTTSATPISLGVDAIGVIGDRTQLGFVLITCEGGTRASSIFMLRGAAGTVANALDPDTDFSTTKDNAGTVNIYYDAVDTEYKIQNKLASAITVFVQRFGRS